MSDQARTLRVLKGGKETLPPGRRSIAVTGGKGGVGKSTLALNLAVAYAQGNAKPLLVDTDLGMADLNLLLGVAPDRSMLDALGGASLDDVLVEAHGIHLLPALNGSYLLSTIGPAAQQRIVELVDSLASRFDTLVMDVAAGIGQSQTTFAGSTAEVVVVVNPEPLSMADAYACLKVLANERGVKHAYIVPNRVTSRAQADEVVARLGALVDRFLDLELTPLPPIPADPAVVEAAQIGVPLVVHAPDSPAARAIRHLTRALATLAPAAQASWWRHAQGARS
jgi:flagellar biosynthesis protein FlhG